MKITRISWTNYKGLADGAIDACGNNVTISGRNGAGKSSIASILPFILFGKGTDLVKRYDDGLTPQDDGLIHAAEVTFDNGITFRREYFWENGGNHNKLYINGAAVSQTAFKASVDVLTGGGGEYAINPFALCNLKATEQRGVLTKIFGTVSDAELLKTEFAEFGACLDGRSVDVFITHAKSRLSTLTTEAKKKPAAIAELQRQVENVNIADELHAVEDELAQLGSQRRQLFKTRDFNYELELAQKRLSELERQQKNCSREIDDLKTRRQSLLDEYHRVRKAKGICPTCGQPLPAEQFKSKRDAKLADIKHQGLQCNSEVEEHEKILADIDVELRAVKNQIAGIQSDSQASEDRAAQIRHLDEDIERLTTRKVQLQSQAEISDRIQTLHAEELKLNRQIATLEGRLADAKNFILRKIELVESTINNCFEQVKFKLFEYKITTGEVRPTCEPTLNGVPYISLSKGEKLRAALDIFRAVQRVLKVELPVMLDDAEAYTTNSLIAVPNQIFAFKVTDDDLNIRVVTNCTTNAA